jgi:hypothetical protein
VHAAAVRASCAGPTGPPAVFSIEASSVKGLSPGPAAPLQKKPLHIDEGV